MKKSYVLESSLIVKVDIDLGEIDQLVETLEPLADEESNNYRAKDLVRKLRALRVSEVFLKDVLFGWSLELVGRAHHHQLSLGLHLCQILVRLDLAPAPQKLLPLRRHLRQRINDRLELLKAIPDVDFIRLFVPAERRLSGRRHRSWGAHSEPTFARFGRQPTTEIKIAKIAERP